ncbi:MAG: VCBS repeat-containing protein [Planctomycetota bacterium]
MTSSAPHRWELTLLDAEPLARFYQGLVASTAADLDGDGIPELVVGSTDALTWYQIDTGKRAVICRDGTCSVGLAIADIDGDGRPEVVTGLQAPDTADKNLWEIAWFKPSGSLDEPWAKHVLEPAHHGYPHDLVLHDVDGDGRLELIANGPHGGRSSLYLYRPGVDPEMPWKCYDIGSNRSEEGLCVVRLDRDGGWGIASGPNVYRCPEGGPFGKPGSIPWPLTEVAPNHREMCRVSALDITGNGVDDLVIIDSEYFEGQLSWLENTGHGEWIEHPIERGIAYGHSLHAERTQEGVRLVVAEMAGGGWAALYNYDARIIEYLSADGGETWKREIRQQGQGIHEATYFNGAGEHNQPGRQLRYLGKEHRYPRVMRLDEVERPSPIAGYQHRFVDRDKPGAGTDILAVDITGNGQFDIAVGRWWYELNSPTRREIPGVCQIINHYDLDGDGRDELIVTLATDQGPKVSNRLAWAKPIDPLNDRWELHEIGTGVGDWPHGSCVAPLLPGGKLALVTAYHSAHASAEVDLPHYPEIWEVSEDPSVPWPSRTLAEIPYGEEVIAHDITGDGAPDLFLGAHWLENNGDGSFTPHRMFEGVYPARIGVIDVQGNGRADVVIGDETVQWSPEKRADYTPLCWYECPANPRDRWRRHVIDVVRCPHSIGVADLDDDGEDEIICGEHDPFYPYRQRCKLYAYKKADAAGRTWKRWCLDDRFEHHDGCKPIRLPAGDVGILSHGWMDSLYVHLWVPPRTES